MDTLSVHCISLRTSYKNTRNR